jgi:LacI family transcriptional regulator
MAKKKPHIRISDDSSLKRVAVLVDTSTTWGRRIITGIHDFSRRSGCWQFFVEARGMEEHLEVLPVWSVEGVIARISRSEMTEKLNTLQVPVVNVSGIDLPNTHFPRVSTNMDSSASLAVEHFVERGFKHFAYFSLKGLTYVAAQQNAFVRRVEERGYQCTTFGVETHLGAEPDWGFDLHKLANWLQELPKPVGIFTWNASSAREVLFVCQSAKVVVPEEVAVLSGADDDLLCEVSHVPISAIVPAAEKIGFEAARTLDVLMNGRRSPKQPILLDPLRVMARQSTDTLAIPDPVLVRAMNFIRTHAANLIQVSEVAAYAGTSRRVLERRFAQLLGRSPAEEIRRQHFERAKQLLIETDMQIPEIADASGFGSPEYMAYVFRHAIQQSPRKYRELNPKVGPR